MEIFISVLLSACICTVFYFIIRRRLEPERQARAAMVRIEKELGSILVEMNNTTERNVMLLEEKVKEVRDLLSGVDKRIKIYKKETEKPVNVTYSPVVTVPSKPPENEAAKTAEKTEDRSTMKEKVLTLHAQGFDPKVIARQTGTDIGEVELIISLAAGH